MTDPGGPGAAERDTSDGVRRWAATAWAVLNGRTVRILVLLAAVGLGAAAVVDDWNQVRAGLPRLGPLPLAGALPAVLVAQGATLLSWRAVLSGLGSPLPPGVAARIFFVGQLGKYLPGSVWPALTQMVLGERHGVPRVRSVTALALTLVLSLATGGVLAGILLPVRLGGPYLWLVAAVPPGLACCHPRLLGSLLGRALRRVGRPVPRDRPSAAAWAVAVGWALVAWLAFGVQILVLAVALGGSAAAAWPLAVGGYALAWCAGLVVVIAPAGAGVREVVLVAVLTPVLPHGEGTLLALVSRLLVTLGDIGCAVLAGALPTRRAVCESPPGDALP